MSVLTKTRTKFKVLATGETLDLSPITSANEKAALEIQAIKSETPHEAFLDVCDIYGVERSLPESIRLAALLKVRELSNGSDCNVKFKCPHCQRPSEGVVMLENVLDFSGYDEVEAFRDLELKSMQAQDIGDLIRIKMSEAPYFFKNAPRMANLFHVKDLYKALIKRIPKLKPFLPCKCPLCGGEVPIFLTPEFCLSSLSEHSLSTMYKTYHALVINGFTKADVDSMLPFEREVQKSLIDKMIEERRAKGAKAAQNAMNVK